MNLIDDKWIPVRRKNGEKIKIAPWQITEGIGTDNKITELAAPRPDFNGALIQFLIGLLQTTCTPENPGEWRKWLNEPPTPDELKKRFETVKYAFNLDGDGPRFMQEVGLIKEKKQNNKTIDEMIIDMPGEQTLKLNKDHFIKRNTIGQLCPHCSTMALFTLQINAPSGGQGHLTGLRGGGPLSTLVYGNKIWETAWLNILEKSKFENLANFEKNDDENKFPWLTNNRNSEKGLMTTPEDIHPAQLYWATPRRIFIKFENSEHQTVCDLCDRVTEQVVKQYCTKPRGINYEGTWRHPLSPMYYKSGQKRGEQDFWLPVHQHERIGYKHWLGYVINDGEKKRPSEIITDIPNKINTSEFRIWAFGYDMDNMKARCWYEGIIPVILIEMQFREIYNHYAANIIKTADKVANDIAWHIKAAIYNVEIETNKNKDFNFVKTRFWQETESGFYNAIKDLRDFITKNNSQIPEEILNNWLKFLAKKAEEIFDDITQSGEFNAVDPGRVAKAWNELYWKIFSDETKSILGLPFEPKQASDKKSKKSKDA